MPVTLTMCEKCGTPGRDTSTKSDPFSIFGCCTSSLGPPWIIITFFFYSHCLHSSVCITFLCVCVCRCLCVCVCATVAAHQIRTLLAWKCQVRAGAYQAPATKEYGNKAGDKWIISCITHFSLAMYLATPTSGPAVSLMISRMWQPETPAPSLDCYQRPLSPQQMCLLCS